MLDHSITPNWWMTVIENDGKWTAIGSRKINRIDIEARIDDYDWPLLGHSLYSPVASVAEYKIAGSVRGFTYTSGTTRLAALGALMDALQKEEEEERTVAAERSKRQEDLKRFGGEVNEELIRKVVRWRKKQAKKAEQEREWDPDGEWEF